MGHLKHVTGIGILVNARSDYDLQIKLVFEKHLFFQLGNAKKKMLKVDLTELNRLYTDFLDHFEIARKRVCLLAR